MPNEEREETSLRPADGSLGFSHLAMNEIAASKTEEPAEVARRTNAKWLWIIAVVAVVAAGGWFLRAALNLPPPAQVQQQFEHSPVVVEAMQQALLYRVTFVSGNKVRLDFTPNLPTVDENARKLLRSVTSRLMEAFIAVRPGRDLYIVGFQDNHQMLEARYLARSTLVTREGGTAHDVLIRVENDTGGITANMPGQASFGR